jgi:ParB/RepB/Spo0J family partition protein
MEKKGNAMRTVGVREIKKSRDLALGAPQGDIAKCEKVISAYGNVVPAIVAADGGMYNLIDGHARLEACMRMGVAGIPAVVADAVGDAEQARLSLLLSASRERGSPLGEGALIEKLTSEHGQSLRELSALVGRSKAWLSKRQTMARELSPAVAEMIIGGSICARTAEEIARLPQGEQALFAANAVRDRLSKDDVHELVRMYRSPDATLELCRAIVESPEDALPSCQRGAKTRRIRSKRREGERVGGAARYAERLLEGIAKMVCGLDGGDLEAARGSLLGLHGKLLVLAKLIQAALMCGGGPAGSLAEEGVSPGKQAAGGGGAARPGGGRDD